MNEAATATPVYAPAPRLRHPPPGWPYNVCPFVWSDQSGTGTEEEALGSVAKRVEILNKINHSFIIEA